MKRLLPILKKVEIELRANNNLSKETLEELAELPDWDYRIVQDFMLRVNMATQANDMSFVFKQYDRKASKFGNKKYDLVIACLRRDFKDTVLTDAWNRLPVPTNISFTVFEIWGLPVTRARNLAVEKACRVGAKYLLFIDDDIIAPQNGVLKLFDLLEKEDTYVVAGNYCRKVEPLISASSSSEGPIDPYSDKVYRADQVCAMGFTLIDLERVSYEVPFPLFWEFGAPDGFWSMGEDAFFTRNLIEYTGKVPLVDCSIKCLHYDKVWKKLYGVRDNDVVYASNFIQDFERMRVPPAYPLILIGIPTRQENDPVAVNLEELKLFRGYRTELFRVWGLNVDEARNVIAQEALKREADYLLFIDDDIVPPKDGLLKLIDHMEKNKDLGAVTGNYLLKGVPPYSVHTQLDKTTGLVTDLERLKDGTESKQVFESNWLIGLGFCLIDTRVFKQARFPWFVCHAKGKDSDVNEDAHFTETCFENGFKVLVDKSIECLHIDYKKKRVFTYHKEIPVESYAGFDWIRELKEVYPT